MDNTPASRRIAWLALIIIVLFAVTIVAAPVWIIQPFRAQTEKGVAVSYLMRRWSPYVTLGALIISFVLVGWIWSGSRRWFAKAALIIILLPLLAVTWFSRQNHFEWMFNPLVHTAYGKTNDSNFVNDSDMVLVVTNKGESVAYPVRLMAYHHLTQDVVGGRAIVATY